MFNILKNVFKRKAQPPPSEPKRLMATISDVVLQSLSPSEIIANFPEEKKRKLEKELFDGLTALKRMGKRMKRPERNVNLIRVNNLFRIIAKYSRNIKAKGVFTNTDERI